MIWDGKCGFCKYWIVRWKKLTDETIKYIPYQKIQHRITEIPKRAFQEKVRFIETDGRVFSGAHAVYRTLQYSRRWTFLNSWYEGSGLFRRTSDSIYAFIAKNRPAFYNITKVLLGSKAHQVKPYFLIYALALGLIFIAWLTWF